MEQSQSALVSISHLASKNASNATNAKQLSDEVEQAIQEGFGRINDAIETMQQIHTASGHIANIIRVMDSISFQTNILALNAAVEAARAGNQGKGFAVVANEVRTLAGRSSTAAQEISHTISSAVEQIEKGLTKVKFSGESFQKIAEGIEKNRHADQRDLGGKYRAVGGD